MPVPEPTRDERVLTYTGAVYTSDSFTLGQKGSQAIMNYMSYLRVIFADTTGKQLVDESGKVSFLASRLSRRSEMFRMLVHVSTC